MDFCSEMYFDASEKAIFLFEDGIVSNVFLSTYLKKLGVINQCPVIGPLILVQSQLR